MEVILNKKIVKLQQTEMFGTEGEIFILADRGKTKCVKIYEPYKRTPYLEKKVLSLIQKFSQLSLGKVDSQIAFPEALVYDTKSRKFCGYVMKYFENHQQISKFSYDFNTFSYGESQRDDDFFISIVDLLFAYLKTLHKAGIILGDINPQNILISKKGIPALVDIDSAQIGTFHSSSQRKDYKDPKVQTDGFGTNKYFVYSSDSDIFSMGIIAYELIVGANPFYYQTSPISDSYYKKEQDISLLDYIFNTQTKSTMNNYKIIKNNFYYATMQRLFNLTEQYPKFTNHLKETFIHSKRAYFSLIDREDFQISFKKFKHIKSVENVIVSSKSDPEELTHFMEQYKISIL